MSGAAPTRSVAFLVTCEHGGNRVPARWRPLFERATDVLASHRGWDAGALPLGRAVARALDAPLRAATITRLLVDLNRSPHNPRVFSEWTRGLRREDRIELLGRWHAPHRAAVEADVVGLGAGRGVRVVHLAIHSFTPSLDGVTRRADLALLYDPRRRRERALCAAWAAALGESLPDLAVRRNQPYRGASDGLTTWLRRRHPAEAYLGIEIEVNQRLLGETGRFPPDIANALARGLEQALRSGG